MTSRTTIWPGAVFGLLAIAMVIGTAGLIGCARLADHDTGAKEADQIIRQEVTPETVIADVRQVALATNTADSVNSQGWGTVTGQVVYDAKPYPANGVANVDKDKGPCLAKGPILENKLVVNPKNGGIRWALVWLTDANDPKSTKAIPTHPSLLKMAKQVEIDQPCCVFEPRVLGMRVGQDLVIKNSSPISHNTAINGGPLGPNINPLIPANGSITVSKDKIRARYLPLPYSCSIHGWMKGWIGIFNHPYFAVTDEDGKFTLKNAPAGKYRLMVWQEECGWVIINPMQPTDRGRVIDIKANGTTDVGPIKYVPSKD